MSSRSKRNTYYRSLKRLLSVYEDYLFVGTHRPEDYEQVERQWKTVKSNHQKLIRHLL